MLSNFRTLSPKLPLLSGSGLPVETYTLPFASIEAPPLAQIAPSPDGRGDVERDLAGSTFAERNQPTVVRAAVAGVAAETDVDASVAERQSGALLDVERVLHTTRIGVGRHLRRAGQRVEADELVMDVIDGVLDRRDHIDRVRRGVDDGRRQNAERVDVAAPRLRGHVGHRPAEVPRPQDGSVVRVECVHRVVLGRGVDATVEGQRLRVYGAVEVVTPRLVRGEQRRFRRVVAGALRIAVVGRPRRVGERRCREGAYERERAGQNQKSARSHAGESPSRQGCDKRRLRQPGYCARIRVESRSL